MSESTHRVEIVPVTLEKHPNADQLSVVKVFGYSVCVRTEDWVHEDRGAYIVPDSVVPGDDPQFAFLANGPIDPATGLKTMREKDCRIKSKKLRGVWSQGMLVKAPYGSMIGEDVAEELGVTRYEPPAKGSPQYASSTGRGSSEAPAPKLICGVYDVESWYRYPNAIKAGEEVIVTEKVHGANFRAVYHDGKLHVGSHRLWKRSHIEINRNSPVANYVKTRLNRWFGTTYRLNEVHPASDWWWTAARDYSLEMLLEQFEDFVFYGEIYGEGVQDLTYGSIFPRLVFFDVRNGITGEWVSVRRAREIVIDVLGLDFVPLLYVGAYDEAKLRTLIDGPSILSLNDQIREGVVIQTVEERFDNECGRVKLKAVSNAYLERA